MKPSLSHPFYQIYALRDPRDSSIRYVGCSVDPYKRLLEHCSSSDYFVVRPTPKEKWITELAKLGQKPLFQILDCWPNRTDEDQQLACKLETFWLQHLLRLGHQLTNIHGMKA